MRHVEHIHRTIDKAQLAAVALVRINVDKINLEIAIGFRHIFPDFSADSPPRGTRRGSSIVKPGLHGGFSA